MSCLDCHDYMDGYNRGKREGTIEELDMVIVALNQKPKKGEWLRMSNLSEQDDYRYKCSHCGNVVHHKNKMDLYTFNSWCGRCGSNNGRESEE